MTVCPTAKAMQSTPAMTSSTSFMTCPHLRRPVPPLHRTAAYGYSPYGSVWDMRKAGQATLTRDDWARAALGAIERGGIDAIAVETIAGELGATKGSFYWHFKNRDALIDAALAEWQRRSTEAMID